MTSLNLSFAFNDWLGSMRSQINSAGQAVNTWASDPFGDYLTPGAGGSNDATDHHFTGQERDTESNNDFYGARYYASSMGRFSSPDPSQLFYADPTNPQSFDLYNYVHNNPLSYFDPSGLTCQTNSSDGTVYDDEDGKGCDVLDKANAAAPANVTVYADGHTDVAQEAMNAAINQNILQYLKQQAIRYPNLPQMSPSGQALVNQIAKDTAALPNICGVGIAAYGGDRVAAGLSADTQNGVQKATGANVVNVPFGTTGFGIKSNITFSGGANGNISYQLYALGGLVGVEVGTNNGDIHNHIQSVSVVASISPSAPHNFTAYANVSNMGDPVCRGQNP